MLNSPAAHLEANNARQVCLNVAVVQDGELQVIVDQNLAVILHIGVQLTAHPVGRLADQKQLHADGGQSHAISVVLVSI